MADTGLSITFLGAAILSAAAAHHIHHWGYHEFWRYPVLPTTQRILTLGGEILFIGASATFLGCFVSTVTS
jgi:hypothetical protein